MATSDYAKRHKEIGLCRSCPKPLSEGSTVFCDFHREKDRVRGRKKDKIESAKLKEDCLNMYGRKCLCCGEKAIQFLTLEHNSGNGNLHRKKLFKHNVGGAHMYRWLKKNNYPPGYSILCMNCNWATRYGSICPHKLKKSGEVA